MVKTWDRDILCIPNGGRRSGGGISFPRGRYRAYLARSGLIGKLHLSSEMTDKDVEDEIRTIFKGPMQNNRSFPFVYLQSTGGGSKTLTIPSQSSSFKWTPQQVARSSQSGTIYILAQDDLYHVDDDRADEVLYRLYYEQYSLILRYRVIKRKLKWNKYLIICLNLHHHH